MTLARVEKTFRAILIHDNKKISGFIKDLSSQGYRFTTNEKMESLKNGKCVIQMLNVGTKLECNVVWEKTVKNSTNLGLTLFSNQL